MSLVARLRRKQPAPGSSGVASAHPIPPASALALWGAFMVGGLLVRLGVGLLLRRLFSPR